MFTFPVPGFSVHDVTDCYVPLIYLVKFKITQQLSSVVNIGEDKVFLFSTWVLVYTSCLVSSIKLQNWEGETTVR